MSNRDVIGRFFRTYGASAFGDTPLQPILPLLADEESAEEKGKVELNVETTAKDWAGIVVGEAPAKSGEYPVWFIDGSHSTLPVLCLRSPQGWPIPVLVAETGAVALRLTGRSFEREFVTVDRVLSFVADPFPWSEVEAFAVAVLNNPDLSSRLVTANLPKGDNNPFDYEVMRIQARHRCEQEMLNAERLALAFDPTVPTLGAQMSIRDTTRMKRQHPIPELHHRYQQPTYRRGDRVFCNARDCLLVVTDWTDAPVPWPRGRLLQRNPGFHSVIVEDELALAIEHESAVAIMYWWGVSSYSVNRWRKALGVNRQNNEGTQLLIHAATAKARQVAEQNGPTEQYRQKQRDHAISRRIWELAPEVTHGLPWTPGHLALLGTMTDREVAALTGHPVFSVKTTRQKLRIPGHGVKEC